MSLASELSQIDDGWQQPAGPAGTYSSESHLQLYAKHNFDRLIEQRTQVQAHVNIRCDSAASILPWLAGLAGASCNSRTGCYTGMHSKACRLHRICTTNTHTRCIFMLWYTGKRGCQAPVTARWLAGPLLQRSHTESLVHSITVSYAQAPAHCQASLDTTRVPRQQITKTCRVRCSAQMSNTPAEGLIKATTITSLIGLKDQVKHPTCTSPRLSPK